MVYLHICAPNDRSGNPCRCYVILDDDGMILDVIDEGYSGIRPVREKWPSANQGPRINVMKKEYNSFMRWPEGP